MLLLPKQHDFFNTDFFANFRPVGWVLGGIVAALFAILPGLFNAPKPAGHITNVQEVIQWKFFGDRDHTGNEQCQSQGTHPLSFAPFVSVAVSECVVGIPTNDVGRLDRSKC